MAAAVPAMVAMTAASTETSRVVYRAFMMRSFWNSSAYQCREKPCHTVRLFSALKEKTMSTKMGA